MARKTVRVDVPIGSPDAMLKLSDDIIKYHEQSGPQSPLNPLPMNTLNQKRVQAKPKRAEAKELEGKAQDLNQEANTLIGIAEGQTSETLDTMHNIIVRVRDLMLSLNKGNEEELTKAGFNVVIGSFAPAGRKPKP